LNEKYGVLVGVPFINLYFMGDEIHSSINCVAKLVKLCGVDRDIKILDVTLTRLLISSTIDIVAKDQSYNDVIVKPLLEDRPSHG
jgi:hypothetical protein